MASTIDLEDLAQTCLETAKLVKTFLASNGHAQMSFDQNGPAAFPTAPVEIQQARSALQTAAKTLFNLATGPDDYFKWTIMENLHDLNAYRYIYHFKIAEAIPLGEEASYAEIATRTGVDVNQLKQMIRHAMTSHIFYEPRPEHVAHTAFSRLFLHDAAKNVIGYITEENMPIANAQVAALERWGHGSSEANESAFSCAFDTNLPMFQYYKQNPISGPRFAKCMHYLTAGDAHSVKNVVSGYDWASLGSATVVDLGGSVGHCSVAIAGAAPELKLIVQDLPNVISVAGSPATTIVPIAIRDRISFMAHDFFQPQPVTAECYFLRFTLHVYSDKYVVKIIQALSGVLHKEGTKVIIMDQIMPAPGTQPSTKERAMSAMNVQMMASFNARERSLDEWKAIIHTANPRLKMKNVITPPGSILSVMALVVE